MGVIDKQPTLHCGLYLKVVAKKEKVTKEALQRLGFYDTAISRWSISAISANTSNCTNISSRLTQLFDFFWPSVKAHCKEIMKPSNYLSNHHPKIKMHSTLVYIKASQ